MKGFRFEFYEIKFGGLDFRRRRVLRRGERATMTIEKTIPATVIIEPATAASISRDPDGSTPTTV